jgi:hypothetical protein
MVGKLYPNPALTPAPLPIKDMAVAKSENLNANNANERITRMSLLQKGLSHREEAKSAKILKKKFKNLKKSFGALLNIFAFC